MYYHQTGENFAPPKVQTQHTQSPQMLAQAYVPEQAFRMLYAPADALKYGTIFEELNLAYKGR